jgi:hypothetical protein
MCAMLRFVALRHVPVPVALTGRPLPAELYHVAIHGQYMAYQSEQAVTRYAPVVRVRRITMP